MGCLGVRAALPKTVHQRLLTGVYTVVTQLGALLRLWAQLNASTLLHGLFSFRSRGNGTSHETRACARAGARLVILLEGQQAGLPGSRRGLTWL